METAIRDAIFEMLASGYTAQQIKDSFSLVDLESLIDEVEVEFNEMD